jgi:sugar phosphate permease
MTTQVASGSIGRWRVPVVLAVTVFVNYLDRNNLALAIPRIAQDFGWSDREVGSNGELLLAAFFISYALSNMLLSPLAERFSPKRSVMISIVAFSLITILCAPLGQSLPALIGLRLLLGISEGVHIPMLSSITSRWFPLAERSRANAIWGGGILVATASAPLIIVPLIHSTGWRSTFAVLGSIGVLVSIPLVHFLVQDEPSNNGMGTNRTNAIREQSASSHETQRVEARYFRDRCFWLVVVGGTLNAFCAFGLLNWLPTYFNRAKGINFERLGWPLALVFTAGIVGIALMAYLGDKLQSRTQLAGWGFLAAGIMVYFASSVNKLGLLVLFFAIAVFCQSAYGAQEYAIVQRLLPANRVGAGTGLYNGLSLLFGGVGGSLIPGSIVAATGSFDAGILSIFVAALLASLVMFVLSRLIQY